MKYLILCSIFFNFLFSQLNWYNHPELKWQTIESEHFKVHFHESTERSAREAIEVAEYVYPYITKLYDFKPDSKTEIIIKDVDDYSNGSAYYHDNLIEIWAKPLDYDLRGSHRWMQDVVSHEFTHIVQLGKSMKLNRFVPGSYIQMMAYEDEKREDVLYGYPNQLTSYFIPSTTVPPWFAEGTAQHTYDDIFFDYWDSIRDMILRDKVLNKDLFTFDEMNTFGKCGLGNELVYNQGYSLIEYIVDIYGEESLKDISSTLSNPLNFSISKSIKNVLNISGYELYNNWKLFLEDRYSNQTKNINKKNNYTFIEKKGTKNVNPKWSPNGEKIAFISNKLNDYFGQTDLFIYDIEKDSSEKIMHGVKSTPTWINDTQIIYTKRSKPNENGSKFFDLYQYDFDKEKETRLTNDARVFAPFFSKKENKVFAINTYDGTSNIAVYDIADSSVKNITDFNDGVQIFSVIDYDNSLLVDAVINHERDFYLVDSVDNKLEVFKKELWDLREPVYKDNIFIYSDDRTGIYNLYFKSLEKEGYITNVYGGAFKPDISINGDIAFSIYDGGGYKLALLETKDIIDISETSLGDNETFKKRPSSKLFNKLSNLDSFNYEDSMTGPFYTPRLTYDYNTVKAGLYLFDLHSLKHMSVFAGASINSLKDLDLFVLFDLNKYKTNYYFNFYWLTRNTSRIQNFRRANGLSLDNITYDVDYSFQLFTFDIGNRFIKKNGGKFWFYYTFSQQRQYFDVIERQQLNESYIEDFVPENEANFVFYDGAYDAFKGQSFTIKYQHDARKKDYLFRMNTKKGIKINNLSYSYEINEFFEGYKVNDDTQSIVPKLSNNNTERIMIDVSGFSNLKFNGKDKDLTVSYNISYNTLINKEVDDFFYFFGGGLPGIKGYTFFDPILQGTDLILLTNQIRFPIIDKKNIGIPTFYINAITFGFINQFARAYNASINAKAFIVDPFANFDLEEFVGPAIANKTEEFDAMDRLNRIPSEYEDSIYVDIYKLYDNYKLQNQDLEELEKFYKNAETMTDLKERYHKFKHSIGLEFRLYAFSFYSFPMAITYEYHNIPDDFLKTKGRQYLKILFDF